MHPLNSLTDNKNKIFMKPFLRKGNGEEMANYTRTGLKISGNKSNWVMNQDLKFGSNRHQYVWKRSGERYNSECLQPFAKFGLGPYFSQPVFKFPGTINTLKKHIQPDFNATRTAFWKASYWQLLNFSA